MAPKIPDLLDELIGGPEDQMGLKKFRTGGGSGGNGFRASPNKFTGCPALTQSEIFEIKNSPHYYVCKKCMGDGRDPVMTGFCRCKACDGQGLFSWIDIPLLRHDIELIEVINGVYKICKR